MPTTDDDTSSLEAERQAIIQLRARLSKLEVELLEARKLSVETIQANVITPTPFLDRHGILGLIFAVFVQTAGVIWWASTITGNVSDLKDSVSAQSRTQELMSKTLQENAERLTRVQTVQENVVKILDQHTIFTKGDDRFKQ